MNDAVLSDMRLIGFQIAKRAQRGRLQPQCLVVFRIIQIQQRACRQRLRLCLVKDLDRQCRRLVVGILALIAQRNRHRRLASQRAFCRRADRSRIQNIRTGVVTVVDAGKNRFHLRTERFHRQLHAVYRRAVDCPRLHRAFKRRFLCRQGSKERHAVACRAALTVRRDHINLMSGFRKRRNQCLDSRRKNAVIVGNQNLHFCFSLLYSS